jgi:hypothetical protein
MEDGDGFLKDSGDKAAMYRRRHAASVVSRMLARELESTNQEMEVDVADGLLKSGGVPVWKRSLNSISRYLQNYSACLSNGSHHI